MSGSTVDLKINFPKSKSKNFVIPSATRILSYIYHEVDANMPENYRWQKKIRLASIFKEFCNVK